MEAALALIPAQLGEIAVFLGTDIWGDIVKGLSAVDFSWKTYAETVDASMPAFTSAMDTFSTLISKILSLSTALKDMRDMTVLSVRDIDEALKNIPVFLDRFVDALALNMSAIKETLKDLDKEWSIHAEEMRNTMPSYEDSTSAIGKLISSLLSLGSALKSLAETGIITEREFDKGFGHLMESITNFASSFSKNVDGLIESMWKLSSVWNENKATLVPLMDTFMVVTHAFWQIANNANAMAESFRDLQKNSGSLEKGFKSLIEFINQVVEGTKEFYTTEAASELARFIKDVGKVIEAFVNLERELNGAMDKVEKAISDAVDDIHKKILSLSELPENAYVHGANTLQSFVDGLIDKEPALKEEMQNIANIIHGFLGVESPTKLGPLSHLEEWPHNLIQSYSSGIEAEMHTLNTSFAGLAPGMNASGAGGGNRSIVVNNTQYINSREDADYANRGLERILQKHTVM
jgi:methyl-accepting chemotaxis protein